MTRHALAQELQDIVGRLRRCGPSRTDPEHFHVERDAICKDAMAIANKLRSREPLE